MASAQVVKHILCNFMCEESDESEACEYCCECAQYLCETCAKQHTKIKKFKHHHYIRATVACLSGLDKAITTCPKHDGQELKYHCEDDGHSMCGECKEAHVGHHFIEIQDKCNDLMKSIGKRLSVPVPKDGIRKTKVEFTKRIENMSYLVKERNEFLKVKLDDMEFRLQEELKKHNEIITQFFDEKIEKAEEKERIRKTFEQDVMIRQGASLYQYLIDLDKIFGKMSDGKSKPGIPTLIDTSIDVQTDGQTYLAALQMYINGPLKTDSGE
ncbi:hypothetical protein FSP39_004700 [Pinctada imbricata]|uniref:B box-type domain-containing protein n=1 Tax=Pinctada imbricata TaxID=66713 RepID=A0AA88YT43_PINIB|nr:hypothetical protein FSP39_004700 [Pinctada imbricata]